MVEDTPPPFFRRGPAPLALLSFYVALSIALFVLDLRFQALGVVRQSLFTVADPLQRLAQSPVRWLEAGGDYFHSLDEAQAEAARLKAERLAAAPDFDRLQQLETENAELRSLLALRQRQDVRGQAASVLSVARDPFSHRVFIDKGLRHGVAAGQPVIDDRGIIGQVTEVFPFSAGVTLLTDKNQAVPVQIQRTGRRSVTFGLGNGQVELKYMPVNADVEVGDLLHTSGLDGIYPAGFQVARVIQVDRDSAYAFARIIAVPLAAVDSRNTVMVLDVQDLSPLAESAEESARQDAPAPQTAPAPPPPANDARRPNRPARPNRQNR